MAILSTPDPKLNYRLRIKPKVRRPWMRFGCRLLNLGRGVFGVPHATTRFEKVSRMLSRHIYLKARRPGPGSFENPSYRFSFLGCPSSIFGCRRRRTPPKTAFRLHLELGQTRRVPFDFQRFDSRTGTSNSVFADKRPPHFGPGPLDQLTLEPFLWISPFWIRSLRINPAWSAHLG